LVTDYHGFLVTPEICTTYQRFTKPPVLAGVSNPRYWLGFWKTPGTHWGFEKPPVLVGISKTPQYYCGFNPRQELPY